MTSGIESEPARRGFRSLTTRLIVFTLLATGGVYAVTLAVSNALARRMAFAAAGREAENETEEAASRIQDVLHAAEEQTRVLAQALEALDPDRAASERLLRRFVPGNPDVWGAAIAFAPGALPRGGHAALYFHRLPGDPQALASADLTAPGYRYWERAWFSEPLRTGEPSWSEPYLDTGGGGVGMVTYSVPFRGKDGRARGVVTADLQLAWLDERVHDVELGTSGFGVIVSRARQVIAASGGGLDRRDARAALSALSPEDRARLEPIVDRIVAGEAGFAPVEVGGVRYRLTYRPIGRAGWALATLYPEAELLDEATRLRTVQAGLALAGLLVLAAVVVLLSRRVARPIQALAAGADRIAAGDLDAELPTVRARDEVGRLALAFRNMRDSLKDYIRDLQLTTAAKERLEGEVRVARRIQADMLPRPVAGGAREGFELAATVVPARGVGGDLYDHFRQGTRVFFLVGDVSGKGIPAALFMARTKTLFEAVAAHEADPGAIFAAANHHLCAENEAGMYVTAVCGSLDPASGELVYAVAGHEPPVLVPAAGEIRPLEAEGGRVLGLIDGSEYPVNRIRLEPGDAIVAYTDGVSEAADPAGVFFERDRLLTTLARHRREPAAGVTAAVLEAVRAFAGGAAQSDDITLLTLRRLALPELG